MWEWSLLDFVGAKNLLYLPLITRPVILDIVRELNTDSFFSCISNLSFFGTIDHHIRLFH